MALCGIRSCVITLCLSITLIDGYRILVAPYVYGRNSRFVNMASLAEILGERGHEVTLVTNHRCLPSRQLEGVEVMMHSAPEGIPLPAEDNEVMLTMLNGSMFDSNFSKVNTHFCDHFLQDRSLLPMLKSLFYDALIVDYANTCARILVDYLNIPTIVWSNFGFGIDDDLFHPILPSFIPSPLGAYSDQMNLWQRVRNFWDYQLYNKLILNRYAFWDLDILKRRYGLNSTLSVHDAYMRARPLVFCNADFSFDYPRPLMPYVIPIAGLFFKESEPLEEYLEKFMRSAGGDGVIVMAFGSLFKYFDEKRSNIIATALSKLPQKIIWRFAGNFSIKTGNNTLQLPWIPQNDLLGHNQTRLFITHCGISSAYEAIYHKVPIVGVPLIADQWFNCEKLTGRVGMGLQVDFFNMNEDEFIAAIREVLSNATYKQNAAKVNQYILDKPGSPKESFLFWTEYVIRNKGVKHLYSDPMWQLKWYQYFSLDVVMITIAAMIVILSGTLLILVLCFRCLAVLCRKAKKEKTQ